MGYFRLMGSSAQASKPVEKIVETAIEAEYEFLALIRACGGFGKVEVFGKDGRTIGQERLGSLARKERAAADPVSMTPDRGKPGEDAGDTLKELNRH